jgi:hypothetical protein
MTDSKLTELPVLTRLALLEARMRIVVLALEGMIVAAVTALIAYFFKGS